MVARPSGVTSQSPSGYTPSSSRDQLPRYPSVSLGRRNRANGRFLASSHSGFTRPDYFSSPHRNRHHRSKDGGREVPRAGGIARRKNSRSHGRGGTADTATEGFIPAFAANAG